MRLEPLVTEYVALSTWQRVFAACKAGDGVKFVFDPRVAMSTLAGPHSNLGLSQALRVVADGLDHCEGLCWDPSRQRVIVGTEAGLLRAVDLESGGNEVVARLPGWILGLAADGAGGVVCCVVAEGDTGLWVARGDGTVERLDTPPITFPNFVAFGPDGSLYATDSGGFGEHDGRVLKIGVDGRASTLTASTRRFPNGSAVRPDGSELWVVESFGPSITAVDLSTGDERVVAYLHGTVPDGITFCSDGSAVVTSYRPDRLYHVRDDGQVRILADDPYGALLNAPTNCCFAGASLDRLVAVNFGRWHLTEVDVELRGGEMFRPDRWAGLDRGGAA